MDLNHRPSVSQTGALSNLSYAIKEVPERVELSFSSIIVLDVRSVGEYGTEFIVTRTVTYFTFACCMAVFGLCPKADKSNVCASVRISEELHCWIADCHEHAFLHKNPDRGRTLTGILSISATPRFRVHLTLRGDLRDHNLRTKG